MIHPNTKLKFINGEIGYGVFDDDDGVALLELESAEILQINMDVLFSLAEMTRKIMQESAGTFIT